LPRSRSRGLFLATRACGMVACRHCLRRGIIV